VPARHAGSREPTGLTRPWVRREAPARACRSRARGLDGEAPARHLPPSKSAARAPRCRARACRGGDARAGTSTSVQSPTTAKSVGRGARAGVSLSHSGQVGRGARASSWWDARAGTWRDARAASVLVRRPRGPPTWRGARAGSDEAPARACRSPTTAKLGETPARRHGEAPARGQRDARADLGEAPARGLGATGTPIADVCLLGGIPGQMPVEAPARGPDPR
jgi:hypothetical protein